MVEHTDRSLAGVEPQDPSEAGLSGRRSALRHPMHPYLELSKARLTSLVLLTTLVGFLMASPRPIPRALLFWTLLGTGLCAAGANALNQCEEVRRDACMERTKNRPLPTGQLSRRHALILALASAIIGVAVLAIAVNPLTAAEGAFVVLLYVLAYTPLKHRTPFCTLVGAVCGAIPPLMGWSGATGGLALGAWILGAILFLWQIPHFLALAWLYRVDYARGGFRMLPVIDPTGHLLGAIAVVYTLALIPLGLFSLLAGITGWLFLIGASLLGAGLFLLGWRLRRELTEESARRLFIGSLIYLPLLLGLMVADRVPGNARHADPITESRYAEGASPGVHVARPEPPLEGGVERTRSSRPPAEGDRIGS